MSARPGRAGVLYRMFPSGGVVDEPALIEALKSGRISAGLDVFPDEPNINPKLLELPNVTVLPHMGTELVISFP